MPFDSEDTLRAAPEAGTWQQVPTAAVWCTALGCIDLIAALSLLIVRRIGRVNLSNLVAILLENAIWRPARLMPRCDDILED
jgi:hypothetical protein